MGESTSCTRGPGCCSEADECHPIPGTAATRGHHTSELPPGLCVGAQAGGEQHREHLHLGGAGRGTWSRGREVVCVCVYMRVCGGLCLQGVGHSCFSDA